MRRINFLYVIVIIILLALFKFNRNFSKRALVFYGFAENKEMEINLDHAIEVNRILVIPGQKVKEGTILAEVSRVSLGLKFNELSHEIAELRAKESIRIAEMKADVNRLKSQKAAKESEAYSKTQQLQAEIDFNQSLLKDLESIPVSEEKKGLSRQALRIKALNEALTLALKPIDIQINRLQAEMNNADNPTEIRIGMLETELQFFEKEKEKLAIKAPSDGVVGTIRCKAGENLPAFSNIISFYNPKPTLVKGFVLESLILKVEIGDSLTVISTLHPEHKCKGVVAGLGSRIVEIPERLRKLPDWKTYGREVLISIPQDNYFLQKEKVILNLFAGKEGSQTFFSLLLTGINN